MKTYRVGVAAMVHDHVWGELGHWKEQPNVELVAAGDVNDDLRRRAQEKYGVARVYDSWQEMLDREGDNLDIVQAASENNVCAEIVEACATRGIHVVSEKPMAANLEQADRMLRAAQINKTLLMINWPTAWSPVFQEMERRILAGAIGDLRYFKYRSAHNGPKEIGCDPHFYEWLYDEEKNGAGALMDYCCYGAAMLSRHLGLPQSVIGMRAVLAKDYPLPDDNAIIACRYAHAFGVCEASWTQVTGYAAANPVAYGSEGAVSLQKDGTLLLLKPGKEPETITPPATESPRRNAAEYFLHCLENQTPIEGVCAADISRNAQEILEAGKRAADSGQTQTLPLGANK